MSVTQANATTSSTCWSCRAATAGQHFCPACGKIQPLPRETDYFAFFGLPRKLHLETAELEKRFHRLSWKLHPDNFVRAGEYERDLSLDRASQLNDAYRALRDPISRVEYLLAREGMRKEGENKQQAPPELLEEVFELNESLDELRSARQAGGDGNAMAALRSRLEAEQRNFEERLREVDADLDGVFSQWDAAIDAGAGEAARKKLMIRMNELLNRRSYIRNLVANVQRELGEA
ncbi:MAG: Fe-S protein assembly co-chaperone HscB [Acidobacteria bacterium]|nr:Fe-S protein assembly co-chaperone HscB [Acidobacteriota bacterium]